MAELVSVYHKQCKDKTCLQVFDDFLNNLRLLKGREHQAMFNNIFKLWRGLAGRIRQQNIFKSMLVFWMPKRHPVSAALSLKILDSTLDYTVD